MTCLGVWISDDGNEGRILHRQDNGMICDMQYSDLSYDSHEILCYDGNYHAGGYDTNNFYTYYMSTSSIYSSGSYSWAMGYSGFYTGS
jgi:hypothetical protein